MNYILSIENPNTIAEWSSTLNESFLMWQDVWTAAFKKTRLDHTLNSDAFSRQTEVLCFRDRSTFQIAGTVCHRYVDTRRADVFADSFFTFWSENSKALLKEMGPRLVIGSQITVPENFRGAKNGIKLKEIISAASLTRVMASKPNCVASMMLIDKGMSQLFESLGAEVLEYDINYHGMPINLVRFHPQKWAPQWPSTIASILESYQMDLNHFEYNYWRKNESSIAA